MSAAKKDPRKRSITPDTPQTAGPLAYTAADGTQYDADGYIIGPPSLLAMYAARGDEPPHLSPEGIKAMQKQSKDPHG
jgi:hypothetical protein